MQMYHGPPIGYNIRLAKGSELGQALAAIEEKMASNKPADTCRSRLQKDFHCSNIYIGAMEGYTCSPMGMTDSINLIVKIL